jgi:hypothetical protein
MERSMLFRRFSLPLISLFAFIYSSSGIATTILGMDIDKVANDAELIFEGEVILHKTLQDSNSGIINTYVTFKINDVLKGDYSSDLIELKFAGGSFNNQIVEVSGLVIPKDGEQGIYFVKSTSRNLLNPLLGWSQGHFLIHEVLGERRMRTIDQKPIIQIQAVSSIPPSIKKPQALIEGNGDVAAGVNVDPDELTTERALTVDEFKDSILELIEN